MTVPVWANCWADVYSHSYGGIARAFMTDVVESSFAALDRRRNELTADPLDIGARFLLADFEVLCRDTGLAFCLAIQSIWERQLRQYIKGCAKELSPLEAQATEKKATSNSWEDVEKAFLVARGVTLRSLPFYEELTLLHRLGSVARHGEGKSFAWVWAHYPEFWPTRHGEDQQRAMEAAFPEFGSAEFKPSMRQIDVSLEWLRRFSAAIEGFWDEIRYIYNENIIDKGPQLESLLTLQQAERANRSG